MHKKYKSSLFTGNQGSHVLKRIKSVFNFFEDMTVYDGGSLIWSITTDGNFSFKSAYDYSIPHSPLSFVWKFLWSSSFPLKLSIFTWKILHQDVPLDSMI